MRRDAHESCSNRKGEGYHLWKEAVSFRTSCHGTNGAYISTVYHKVQEGRKVCPFSSFNEVLLVGLLILLVKLGWMFDKSTNFTQQGFYNAY
ncbi:hypothetical protein TNIN_486941 [Trichonephila inaurata madagascariensis]|uniref:Uncharacterized protein n=1 Tax=Trichonephila inaurata madagascariensis TaxID=2747483 RepID=A0A8X7BPK7_9ARAC|nr:hypothetical protein TNIN_486941 [Trichonephila inaurata madagascariensis]